MQSININNKNLHIITISHPQPLLSDRCLHCGVTGTLHHILNNCITMMDRYKWCHNCIIANTIRTLRESDSYQNKTIEISADVECATIMGDTIPPAVHPTQHKPDICILNSQIRKILLMELTVPFETNIDKVHNT